MLKFQPTTKRLFGYWRRHRTALVLGIGCVFFGNAIAVMAPIVVRDAINDLLREVTDTKLYKYSGLVLAITLVEGIFLFLQRRILVGMSRDIEYEMRNDFFAHLLRLEPGFYHENRTGDLMSRATNDLNAVRMMVGPAVMYLTHTVAVFIFAIPVMLQVNVALTLMAISTTPLVSYATRFFGARIHERFQQVQEYLSAMSARAQENFSGVRVVRAFAQESSEIEVFRKMNRDAAAKYLSVAKLSGMFFPTLHALVGLALVVVLWYGGTLTARGAIDVGQFVQFNLYLSRMIWPMIALGWVVNLVQRGMASMKRIHQILDRAPEIADLDRPSQKADLVRVSDSGSSLWAWPNVLPGDGDGSGDQAHLWVPQGRIEFRGVTFGYRPETPVLRDIDLEIEAGKTIAVVGRTGSGKTTLVNLIPRLIDPPAGRVFIDGHDVREIPLARLRRAIGFVSQEPFLFSMSIAENIGFGPGRAGMEDMERAAEQAGLLEDVRDFPAGFQTVVGERGITLSGGQKQRTAIARAILRRPRILILDDALSSVDTHTEEKILQHLRSVMRQSTSIIISHRISTVQEADRIIVLEDGRIVEQGTHESLLERGGLYAELYEKQLLEEELAASE